MVDDGDTINIYDYHRIYLWSSYIIIIMEIYIYIGLMMDSWLVVSTILTNICQWEWLSHILWNKCLKPPTSISSMGMIPWYYSWYHHSIMLLNNNVFVLVLIVDNDNFNDTYDR